MDMSEIVITGSTGAVGRRAVRELIAAGHAVTGVTRSARGRAVLEGLGAAAVEADVFDAAALERAFAGADVVVNLLTHVPPAERMGEPGAWEQNDRLRVEASAAIAAAASAAGARRLVQESLAFVYADGGDAWLDEDAPVDATGRTETAMVAEATARDRFPGDTVVLRFGFFQGEDAMAAAQLAWARGGVSPSLGPRGAYRATVWIDDAARAVVAALDVPPGTYNVVDDEPATRGEEDAVLAALAGVDALRPALDELGPDVEALGRSQRVSNRRLREASGWAPRVHGATAGWRLVAEREAAAA
jgi:nucleoside-diphosphate-sugar epimerase